MTIQYLPILSLLIFSIPAIPLQPDTRIRIAVVDTGVNLNKYTLPYMCRGVSKSLSETSAFQDKNGHGTNIVSILVKNLNVKKYCIEMIKYDGSISIPQSVEALQYAIDTHAQYLNLSLSGPDYSPEEFEALSKVVAAGIHVAVAAGNDHLNLDVKCNIFPACYPIYDTKYFHVIGSYTGAYSNYGVAITHWEDGTLKGTPPLSGTSQATAVHINYWIRHLEGL